MGCCGGRDEKIDDDLYGCNTIDELISAINQQLQNLKKLHFLMKKLRCFTTRVLAFW